jgi:hypothetical protein
VAASSIPLTQERLKELLSYDPETGVFTWVSKPSSKTMIGSVAGTVRKNSGYVTIIIGRIHYFAHRLAWLYTHGAWPKNQIDHINCNPNDNRIANLRESNQSQNKANDRIRSNNTSGFKGVSWSAERRKWQSHIMVNYRSKHLGCYHTREEAHAAYVKAAQEHFGEFARAK